MTTTHRIGQGGVLGWFHVLDNHSGGSFVRDVGTSRIEMGHRQPRQRRLVGEKQQLAITAGFNLGHVSPPLRLRELQLVDVDQRCPALPPHLSDLVERLQPLSAHDRRSSVAGQR